MNKFSRLLLLLVVISMLVGCFAACELIKPQDDNSSHEHSYVDGKCECGESDPDAHVHSFVNGKCECGESDPDAHTHSYVNGVCQCGHQDPNFKPEFIDYASQVKFNPNSGKIYAKVTVKSYIDGDTTHFYINSIHGGSGETIPEGYVKARYLGINTPESTGVIEAWGKKASNYTKTQLMSATSIIIESDTSTWNLDSTGARYLLWVWYRTSETEEYRNLNLEILQQGLAYGSNVSSNTYAEYALAALNQAKTQKLHVFSKEKDPDFYYGSAVSLTLKELKSNTYWDAEQNRYMNKYEGMLVKFEAVVAKQVGATVYVEEYDADTDMYFGMQIFCGYNYPRMEQFAIGNRLSIVGTLQYYENGSTFQVSNLKYKTLDPDWDGGCRVLDTGFSSAYNEITVDTLMNGSIILDVIKEEEINGETVETLIKQPFDYGELAHYSTATVKNLKVQSVYTTDSDTDSDGALTITCVDIESGITIKVRTASKLIYDNGEIVVAKDFPAGTVISVKGIVDTYRGEYQIKVFSINDITFE